MDFHLLQQTDGSGTTTGFGNLGIAAGSEQNSDGSWFSGLSIDGSVVEEDDATGSHTELLGAEAGVGRTINQDGSTVEGFDLSGALAEVDNDQGTVSLGELSATSQVHSNNGASQMVVDGGAVLLEAETADGTKSTAIGDVGLVAHSGTGGFGFDIGPTLGESKSTSTGQGADGGDATIETGLSIDGKSGLEVSWGDQNGDGVSNTGAMVHGGDLGQVGLMVTQSDPDHDGVDQITGGDIGFGPGSFNASATDVDTDGKPELNIGGELGPAEVQTNSESGGGFLDAAKNWAKGAWDTTKIAWSGFFGK
jgi:hypothetical protein